MGTVIITDGRYRSAISAARELGRAGYDVVVTETRADTPEDPPVFSSRFARGAWITGSVRDAGYPDRLLAFLRNYDRPVLMPVGAATLKAVSERKAEFAEISDFLVAGPSALEALNDKNRVHEAAEKLGLPVPRQYDGVPERYPVIVKPRCGEAGGLKAKDRYCVANNAEELSGALERFRAYDPDPIVQERIMGDGEGVSVLMAEGSRLVRAICHRRIREYPMSGGPSTCCVSEYDAGKIDAAVRLLTYFGFVGLAMVEFKGDRILEVNPRIWGSFPLTVITGAGFCESYAREAKGEIVPYTPKNYETGRKMRFFINDLAACADLLRHGRLREGASGLLDVFRVPEGLADPEDRKAYQKYIKSYFRR